MTGWEKKWKMNFGSLGLQDAEFTLKQYVADTIVYYRMQIHACGFPEAWADCALIRRGMHVEPWSPLNPLPPWEADGSQHQNYQDEITEWRKRVTAATRRLEGELLLTQPVMADPVRQVIVSPMIVTMFMVPDAVQDRQDPQKLHDLLLVRIGSLPVWSATVGAPDDTGHGDPT